MDRTGKCLLFGLAALSVTGCSVLLGLRDDYGAATDDVAEAGLGDALVATESSVEAGRDASIDGPPASCSNGVRDGTETDLDCGGDQCLPCANAKACAVDRDCTSGSCAGTCKPWVRAFGPLIADSADGFAVAVGATGDVAICGRSNVGIDLDGGTLPARGAEDIFVAKLASNGALRWARRFGGASTEICYAVAMDAAGNVVIGGTYFDGPSLDLVDGGVQATATSDAFVAKLASATGAPLWLNTVASPNPDRVYGLAVDPGGDVLATGELGGQVLVNGITVGTAVTTKPDVLVMKLNSATGVAAWAKSYASAANDTEIGRAITSDAVGNVFVTGSFRGSIVIGLTTLTSLGGHDAFVAQLTPKGAPVWAVRYGGSNAYIAKGPEEGLGIAVDATGVFVTGRSTTNGSAQAFVAKLGLGGSLLWDVVRGGAGPDVGNAVALDPAGNAFVTGQFTSATLAFGVGAPLLNADDGGTTTDVFLAKLAGPDGGMLAAERYGGGGSDFGFGVSTLRGNTVLAGTAGPGTALRGVAVPGQIFVGSLGPLP